MLRPNHTDAAYTEQVKDFYRYVETYDWVAISDTWQGPESWLHRAREQHTRSLIKKHGRGERYLDVGCGTGLLLRHLPAGATGLDLNPRHLAHAQRYVPSATLVAGDAEKLPFPDNTFSTVICTEVIEHLVHPEVALAEIQRVLQPDGVLIGSTPRRSWLWRLRWLSRTHHGNEPFHHEFTRKELTQLLQPWHTLQLATNLGGLLFFFAAASSKLHSSSSTTGSTSAKPMMDKPAAAPAEARLQASEGWSSTQ